MTIELTNAEEFISWIKTKAELNAAADKARSRVVKRGQVYWCHLGINVGSEMSKVKPRPVVIVQNNAANTKSPNTIVVPITHNMTPSPYKTQIPETPIDSGEGVLKGCVNASNILCISKARLCEKITTLSPSLMKKIDQSIFAALDFEKYFKYQNDET